MTTDSRLRQSVWNAQHGLFIWSARSLLLTT